MCTTSTARSSAIPDRLRVLGDGRQEKSYLYVGDCIAGILAAAEAHESRPGEVGVYNLGRDETVVVDDSVAVITEHMGVSPEIEHTGGRRGWAGDSPLIHLDCSRIRSLGWTPTLTIRESIVRTLDWFDANPYAWESAIASEARSRMSVIFSRAPLRISLGGGGTDLPSYYREHGGFLVAGAIDKYIYMLMHTVFQRRYRMKYSETEDVQEIADIQHPILRETLARHWRGNPVEIASVADVPSGTGMGSSGAFTVALIKGLAHARRTSITQSALAESAAEIEIDILHEPCGKQDPYVAAHGGICAYTFNQDGTVPSSRSSSRPRRCAPCASRCCCSTRARPVTPRPSSPTRTPGPRPAMTRCSRTCTGPRRWDSKAVICSSPVTCSPTPS